MSDLKNDVVFVSSTTNTKGLATCIFASKTKENKEQMTLRAIGAGAISQVNKAYIIAKSRLMEKGINVTIDMYFKDIKSNKEIPADQVDSNKDTITALEYVIKFV